MYVYSHTKDFYIYVYLYTKHSEVKYIFRSICTIIVNTLYSEVFTYAVNLKIINGRRYHTIMTEQRTLIFGCKSKHCLQYIYIYIR